MFRTAVGRNQPFPPGSHTERPGQMGRWFPAIFQPNYKTTQRSAHSWGWGGQPLVTGGKIDDVGVTHRVETHPDISTLLSARVKEGNEALGGARPLKRQR